MSPEQKSFMADLGVTAKPTITTYVRQQFCLAGAHGAQDTIEPATNPDSGDTNAWDEVSTSDVKTASEELTEALGIIKEWFHEDHEVKYRCWIETTIRAGGDA